MSKISEPSTRRKHTAAVAILSFAAVGAALILSTSAASSASITKVNVSCSNSTPKIKVTVGQTSRVIYGPPNSDEGEDIRQFKGTTTYSLPKLGYGKSKTIDVVIKTIDYKKDVTKKHITWTRPIYDACN